MHHGVRLRVRYVGGMKDSVVFQATSEQLAVRARTFTSRAGAYHEVFRAGHVVVEVAAVDLDDEGEPDPLPG